MSATSINPASCPQEAARSTRSLLDFRGTLLASILLLLITFILYGRSLGFDFVWDDGFYIHLNFAVHGVSWAHLKTIWTRVYLGHYAPVHHTALMLLYGLSRGRAFGFHLGQLLLHAACVVLVYVLLRKLEEPRVALLAALVFVVHPTSVETVAWISETKSTLAFLFFLLSFLCFIRFRERQRLSDGVLSGIFLVVSVLAKINTIVAPAIFLLYDWRHDGRILSSRVRSLAVYFLLGVFFVAVHLISFHGSSQNLEAAYYGGVGTHLLNLPLLISFYVQMTIYPHPLSAWQMFPAYEHVNLMVALGWLGLLTLLAALGVAGAVYQKRDVVFWGLWFLIFLAPVLQIVPFPIWVADRYLYIPLVGGAVLASKLFWAVCDHLRVLWQRCAAAAAAVAALAVLSWQTWNYLPVWKDDLALWTATTPTCLSSAFCHCNLGDALLRDGQSQRGMNELIYSVKLHATPVFLIHLGDAYTLVARDYQQAAVAYEMARQQGGADIGAAFYAKLARLKVKTGDHDAAREAVANGAKLDPADPELLAANAFLQWRLTNIPAARASLDAVLAETNSSSNPAAFLVGLWGNPAEVQQFLAAVQTRH